MKLYDIPIEFADLEMALVESGGELTPELEAKFDQFLRAGKDKLEAAVTVVRGLEMEADVCRQESKRLQERAGSLDINSDRLKKMILVALDSAFAGKVKTSLFTIWGQTSAPTYNFDLSPGTELTELPTDCIRTKVELAKDVLKDKLKKNEPVPEAIIVTEMPGTRFLRIK